MTVRATHWRALAWIVVVLCIVTAWTGGALGVAAGLFAIGFMCGHLVALAEAVAELREMNRRVDSEPEP